MLTIHLDDVFSSSRTAHDKAAIVWLNENIPLSRSLDVIHHLPNRALLSRSQPSMLASRDA